MSTRTISLVLDRQQPGQRAHFGIWVPYDEGSAIGTVLHVVGAPISGYRLEFKRRYNPWETVPQPEVVPIGCVNVQYVHNFEDNKGVDTTPRDDLELVATQIQAPRISASAAAPVNDTTNRRSQEWTMDYVRRLVAVRYIDASAVPIVQAKRDDPWFGLEKELQHVQQSGSDDWAWRPRQ